MFNIKKKEKMKKFFNSLKWGAVALAAVFAVTSCSDSEGDEIKEYDVTVTLSYEGIEPAEVSNLVVKATSSKGVATVLDFTLLSDEVEVTLTAGTYTFSVTGDLTETTFLVAQISEDIYSNKTVVVPVTSQTQSTLVFKTIYQSSIGYYITDCYFEIVNNSDETQYLDQLIVLANGVVNLTAPNAWQSNGYENLYNCGSGYVVAFPGSGTDYPLEPGASVLVANTATAHVSGTYNMPDLSSASFEIYNPDGTGGDSDYAATNMDIIFANNIGAKYFGFGVNGIAICLSRPTAGSTAIEYGANAANQMTTPGTASDTKYLMIDTENVLDAVHMVAASNTTPYGFFLAQDDANPTTACTGWSGNVLIRKSEVVDGVTKYIDTNNSANDFLTEQPNPYITY